MKSIIEKDVVLVYIENQPSFFARVEKIIADIKPGWWQVTFLMLKIPLETFTWILDNEQIRGTDFTMGGTTIRIEKITAPAQHKTESPSEEEHQPQSKHARVFSLNTKNRI